MQLKLAAAALASVIVAMMVATGALAQDDAVLCDPYARSVQSAAGNAARLGQLTVHPRAADCPAAAAEARRLLGLVSPPPPPPTSVSPPVASPPSQPATRSPPPPSPPAPSADEVAWRNAQRTNTCESYRGFVSLFADSRFASQARQQRDRLCAPTPSPPPARTSPPPPAVAALDARTTPASTRAPVVRNPASLPDFALFRECDGCPEMVVLPGGTFQMGSPASEAERQENEDSQSGAGGSQVRVQVPRFAIARFETTWDEWAACVSAGVCQQRENGGFGRGRRPVINVDWQTDTRAFISFVNGRASGYRLPSEAEWEYAARAGTTGRFSNNGALAQLCQIANHADQLVSYSWRNAACSDGVGERTAPVGRYAANPFGLYDMHGNVWEWVEDCYRDNLSGQTAAAYTTSGCISRVLRGGSWNFSPRVLRSAMRIWDDPTYRGNYFGFRLARDLEG